LREHSFCRGYRWTPFESENPRIIAVAIDEIACAAELMVGWVPDVE